MSEQYLTDIVSTQQCEEILRKFSEEKELNLKLLRYTVLPAKDVKGFLGEYYRMTIEYRTELGTVKTESCQDDRETTTGEVKFFIKKLPLVDEKHEKVMIFRKESGLYSSLLPELQKYSHLQWSPKIYFCTENMLVLQDLENIGYRSLASKANLCESEMLPILKSLASMHASSLLYERNNAIIEAIHGEYLKEITVHPDIPWFTTGINALIDIAKCHPRYQEENVQLFISNELPKQLHSICVMLNPSKKYHNVVCHRDPWGGNIFLNTQNFETSAIFVDFQTCRYCPPVIDVIFTLFMNLTKTQRLERQIQYLQYYWQQLEGILRNTESIKDFGLCEKEFLASFEEFKLFGLVYRALAVTILNVPIVMVTDEYKNIERTDKLLEYMAGNEDFRLLMEECVGDIIEVVFDGDVRNGNS